MKKETRGRPKKKKSEKRIRCAFTVRPEVHKKFKRLKARKRSLFIEEILADVPDSYFEFYKKTPQDFLRGLRP